MYLIIGLRPPPVQCFPSQYQSQLPSQSSLVASRAKCWDVGDEQICTSGGARSYPVNIFIAENVFTAILLRRSLLQMKGVLMNVLKDFPTNNSICPSRYHVKN